MLDTVDIETGESGAENRRPVKLAGALKAHVSDMTLTLSTARAQVNWFRSDTEGGLHQIERRPRSLESAQYHHRHRREMRRNMNAARDRIAPKASPIVRTATGPLFKGKRVAVIGGATPALRRPSICRYCRTRYVAESSRRR